MHSESLPRLKAPRDHGAILAYPPLDQVGSLLAANLRALSQDVHVQGRSLAELRSAARTEAFAAAQDYLRQGSEPIPNANSDVVLVAGHQPELFHPGVWFKNFALQGLARRHGAVALNLIVDNDSAKTTTLRVPHGIHQAKLPLDAWHSETPYEERIVMDEALFASLPARAEPLLHDWPFRPLLQDIWAEALRQGRRTRLLGERLAAARRFWERAWGAHPWEVPLSRICQTSSFAWFAIHVLRELPRFHADYNAALRKYRERHELRSPLHPVPDLAADADWLESPFWAWRQGASRRERLWAQIGADGVRLRAGDELWPTLRGDGPHGAAQWHSLESAGRKIRTRALTTTLFSRLLLGDLFIHGIGGGKYDEVTDDLFRSFFGLQPPAYLVLTATLLLPLERFPEADEDYRRLSRLQRDLRWNPQRHCDGAAPRDLLLQKEKWRTAPVATHAQRQERFAHFRTLNERLIPFVRAEEERVRQACAEVERRRRLHEVRSAREYAFCLYPEEMLRAFYRSYL